MSLILRNVKGSPLTYTEMDGNLTYLEGLAGSTDPVFTTLSTTATASVGSLVISNTASIATSDDATDSVLTINNATGKINKKSNDLYKEVVLVKADILSIDHLGLFQILPAPGANKYYLFDKIVMEYTYVGDTYVFANDIMSISDASYYPIGQIKTGFFQGATNAAAKLGTTGEYKSNDSTNTISSSIILNSAIGIYNTSGANTATSVSTQGTIKIKMWYSIETVD